MNEFCRCCLKTGSIDLNLTFFNSLSLASIIKICTQTAIEENDNLPKKICRECCIKLESCYLFLDNFHRVQDALSQASSRILEKKVNTQTKGLGNDSKDCNVDSIKSEEIFEYVDQEIYIIIEDDPSDSQQHKNHLPVEEEFFTEEPLLLPKGTGSPQVKEEFDCTECDRSFPFDRWLIKHCKDTGHARPKRFLCDKCPKKFLNETHLKRHYETHANEEFEEKPLLLPKNVCLECDSSFESNTSLVKHCRETGHPRPKRFLCDKCPKKFSDKTKLIRHSVKHTQEDFKEKTLVQKEYNCIECNESFPFDRWLMRHCRETGHSRPRRFQCDICFKKCATKESLKHHYRIHTKEKPHSCKECGMKFSQPNNLKRHMRTHTGERPFQCDKCGKRFSQNDAMKAHRLLHTGETPYICEECGKGFRTNSLLQNHLKLHRGMYRPGVKVKCEICEKILTKKSIQSHMDSHKGIKKFSCECGKKYTSRKALEIHMNIHAKRYECSVCFKLFSQKAFLTIHERIHSGVKPHRCEICDKTFTQRGHLGTHMKTHTGARPYSCEFCGRSFALNGNLTAHKMIHTGEARYKCSVCDKGFLFSSKKRKHEITVHQLYHS